MKWTYISLFAIGLFFNPAGSTFNLAMAKEMDIPNARQCLVDSPFDRPPVPAAQVRGATPFTAEARWAFDGTPVIVYGREYFSTPSFMQQWISAHECGHLTLRTLNEFEANCYALRTLRLAPRMLDLVARYHRSMGYLSPQYGGNGEAFWRGTLSTCRY